jgi:hypothetical protein
VSIFSRLFGGRGGESPLPELTSDSEEGWYDCVFAVEREERAPGGGRVLQAAALHAGERVALEAVLDADWKPVTLSEDPPIAGFRGEVWLRRPGVDGDALLRGLDALYDAGVGAGAMAAEVAFTAISLEGDPRAPDDGPVKLKLFYEPQGLREEDYEDWYAEAYLNLDLAARRLWLAEKDEDYRAPLVRALAGILPPSVGGR